MRRDYTFYVYILTNPRRTTLYIGVTNSLRRRLPEHYKNRRDCNKSFTGRYNCTNLIYFEVYKYVLNAIAREKQLKRWSRKKKEELINRYNPKWEFLNTNFHLD